MLVVDLTDMAPLLLARIIANDNSTDIMATAIIDQPTADLMKKVVYFPIALDC